MDEERLRKLEAEDGTKVQKAKVRKIIREKRDRLWEERERLERWIAGIEDSVTRKIFTLRFVEGKKWMQVANEMGGNNTEEAVRSMARRYVKRQNKIDRS